MGLKSWLFGDFIDLIEWKDNDKSKLLYKFPLNDKEISYNAKLIVNQGEVAIFVLNKTIFDALTYGEYLLNSQTLPNIAKELGWDEHYDEPFSLDIIFINRESYSFRWSNKEPILLHDKENSIAKLKASGEFNTHIIGIKPFIEFILNNNKSKDNYKYLISSIFNDSLIEALIKRKTSIFSLGSNKEEFSQFLYSQLIDKFTKKGLILDSVETYNLEVEQKLPDYTGLNYENDKKNNNHYYIIKNSKPDGPYTKDEIINFLKEEKLIPASYIWRDGLKTWVKVKDIFDIENI